MTRVLAILRSTAAREAARLDLALTRGLFLLVAFAMLLPLLALQGRWAGAGPLLPWVFLVLSLGLLLILAVRLGGDGVGDFSTGLLELLFVTGLKPRQWLAVRLTQTWVGFASVWIVRLPILVCLYALANVPPARIAVVELMLLTVFLLLSALALAASFKAKSRQQVGARLLLLLLAWEMLLHAPRIATGILSARYGWSVPAAAAEWMERAAAIGLTSRLLAAMTRPLTPAECVPTFILYALLSGLVLWRFLMKLRAASQGRVDAPAASLAEDGSTSSGPRRASRRCWDDALAWQAFCVHGFGKPVVQVKCAVYSLLAIGLWVSIPFGYLEPTFVAASATCGILMLVAVNKPSDCLSREIRDQTMPTLLLTPNGSDDFYAGWQRGARYLAWPDAALAAAIALAAFALNPIAPAVVVSLAIAILFSGPFMMLSPLVPFNFWGVVTGVVLTGLLAMIAVVCIIVGAAFHPVCVPPVLVPLAMLFNRLIRRRVLPYWMNRKISTIV